MHSPIHGRIKLPARSPLVDEPVGIPVRPEGAALLCSALLPPILACFLAQHPVEEVVEELERDRFEAFLWIVLEERAIPTTCQYEPSN